MPDGTSTKISENQYPKHMEVSSPEVKQRRRSHVVMTPKLAMVLDVYTVSDRNAVHVIIPTAQASVHDVQDLIFRKMLLKFQGQECVWKGQPKYKINLRPLECKPFMYTRTANYFQM